ncbi:MAG: hypothetical protein O6933_07750 [Planctomycetota bacterium]|nr:hypothetical protein [Planctomycetota bacterium]
MIRAPHHVASIATGQRQPTVDRVMAARLLRTARSAAPDDDDSVEWALSAMPDSLCTRKLKIELLLRRGDIESASALIAQGLLLRPTDAALGLLRARSFYAQGHFDRAGRELGLVIAKRPHHSGALELAGEVAHQTGDAKRAAEFFEHADQRRPSDRTKGRLGAAWLDAGRPDLARGVLQRIQMPTALLGARVLRAEGRLLEATETLVQAHRDQTHSDDDAIVCELIDVLEETADLKRLRQVLEPIDTNHPDALARAGRAWLGMGAFHTAALRMAKLARVSGYRAEALMVLLIAAAMINRPTLARRALQRLRRTEEPVERNAVAETWGRGLLGRILLNQRSARKAGADPHTGRLQELLEDAAKVFDLELFAGKSSLSPLQRRELQEHRTACRAVLSQFHDEAAGSPETDAIALVTAQSARKAA